MRALLDALSKVQFVLQLFSARAADRQIGVFSRINQSSLPPILELYALFIGVKPSPQEHNPTVNNGHEHVQEAARLFTTGFTDNSDDDMDSSTEY